MLTLTGLRIGTDRLADWQDFAALLGLEAETRGAGLILRLADGHVLDIAGDDPVDLSAIDLVGEEADLAAVRAALDARGDAHWQDGDALCFRDGGGTLLRLRRSDGADGEGDPRPRIGHVLLKVGSLAREADFYRGVCGGRPSDRILLANDTILFLHINDRHHSVALMEGRGGSARRLQHFMVEYPDLEALGSVHDRLLDSRFGLAASFGQHSNDRSLSCYAATPSGLWVELGHGGVRIEDPAGWQARDYHATSLWGHRPVQRGG